MVALVRISNTFLAIFTVLLALIGVLGSDGTDSESAGTGTCDASSGGGSCAASGAASSFRTLSKNAQCGLEGKCYQGSSLYERGGTAQAYKPLAPISTTVCDVETSSGYRYKTASWPFNRRSGRQGSAPSLDISLRLYSCDLSNDEDCCCKLLSSVDGVDMPSSIVEVWQTRPDGTYSSLKGSPENDECRARVPIRDDGSAAFSTVAPGSTGMLHGLGPGGWDSNPYGPPSIHMLATVSGHEPLLVDLPALIHPRTLQQRNFMLPDWRGVAWVKSGPSKEISPSIQIDSWEPNVADNVITLKVSMYLQQSQEGSNSSQANFCPSFIYGHPSSFFLEPITMCAPSMLDFFDI